MSNKRRYIAVIISDVCEVYQSQIIKGIKESAVQHNYNVAVFASFFARRIDTPLNEIGEENIFALINYELFDAFIVIPNTISTPEAHEKIATELQKSGKPVIYIDNENPLFYNVCADDRTSIKNVTNHLIREHGFTRINCITGYKDFNLSENRLLGYFDALKENNIEIEEGRYTYGDFWRNAPIEFVEHIFNCGLELPQAIVCANDTMAIATCEELKKRGKRVPEDIAVVGFDRIIEGKINVPQLSSVEPAMSDIGIKAIEIIDALLAGETVDQNIYVPGKFYPSESCGHEKSDSEDKAEIERISKQAELSQYLINTVYMSENLQESANVDEVFRNLGNYMHLLNDDIKTLHIYLCENWDVLNENRHNETPRHMKGYSDVMINKFYSCHEEIECPLSFATSEMFPPIFYEDTPPEMYFFFPINFQDSTFGYAVCSCLDSTAAPNAIFRNWIKYLSNALEYLRSRQHLQWALKRLERMSEMDSLTGVYNRYGYENRVHALFEDAKEQSKDFLVIMGDLDCLKMINDTYGHGEGDNAIRIIAKAFQNSFTEDEICARIGGDEFIMFGIGDFDEAKLKTYPERINEYLNHYNSNSSKPYIIGISIGMYCAKVPQDAELKEWLDKADENMYADKKSKNKVFRK